MSRAAAREAHIEELCAAHGIVRVAARPDAPRSWRRSRRIAVGPARGPVGYFVALHEIGHVLGAQPAGRLEREAAAWCWALTAAREAPTGAVRAVIRRSLAAHLARAERRRAAGAPFRLPPAEHVFWTLCRTGTLA